MVSADPLLGRSRDNQFLPEQHGRSSASVKSSLKPRNREVTSRYKTPAPASSSSAPASRRFASPSLDRLPHLPDVASPKRSISTERRRPSPTRSLDIRIPDGSVEGGLLSRRAAARSELLWPSSRNMFSSMQGESFASRSKSPANARLDSRGKSTSLASDHTLRPSANVVQKHTDQCKGTPERKGTPLRRQSLEQAENARPAENLFPKPQQHRWGGSSTGKVQGAAMSRSVDLTGDRERHTRTPSCSMQGKSTSTSVVRSPRLASNSRVFSQSINEGSISSAFHSSARKPTLETRTRSRESPANSRRGTRVKDSSVASTQLEQSIQSVRQSPITPLRQSREEEAELANAALSDSTADVYVSTSSEGAADASSSLSRVIPANETVSKVTRRGAAPARFLQDAAGRSRNPPDIGKLRSSTVESEAGGKSGYRQKSESKAGYGLTASHPLSRWPQHLSSAFKPSQQSLSPVRIPSTSPLRGLPSPTRFRASTISSPARSLPGSRSGGAAVMLNFGVEARKGKKALTQAEEAFLHRILHNRVLQWCFVNARAEFATNAQTLLAEKSLFSVWTRTTELRKSVTTKRIKLQQARQTHKLSSILRAQVLKLEDWSNLQQEHGTALLGAVGALEAAVLRVPVNEGVRADAQEVEEAIFSAMDVVHTLESSITNLLPKLEKTNKLASDLAQVAAQERTLLEECGDLLSIASMLEVEECSLRTHLVQVEQERARVLGHLVSSGVTGSSSVLVSSS